ncbi:hypothetical protein CHARACLAT_009104 [Characodon lateralis]|uniref:Secreted protein n=1 Tax=Characodon lateralis TaxID=208331 RepID=A0ABU7EJA4_9TELE|nr:hypothetical protein [Characodon lateralis]
MDTLFSVFLGVVILCLRVGSISAQLPTAHLGRAEKGELRLVNEELRYMFHCSFHSLNSSHALLFCKMLPNVTIHPSIHPSILFRLSVVGSREQQPKQRDPDFHLTSRLGQLVGGNPKAFPGQPRNIVLPACPRSSSGPPAGGTCPEHLTGRHPYQMPVPTQLAPLNVEKQRLFS